MNAPSNIEQLLEAAPHKPAALWPLSPPPWKLSKLDEPDTQETGGEVGTDA